MVTASAPIVTIIVPGRDIGAFAPSALDSLRAQTETCWQAILVADGSVDETAAVFADAPGGAPRFRPIRNDAPHGLGAARNIALPEVDTESLGFLDGDDELDSAALARLTRTLADSGSDFVA